MQEMKKVGNDLPVEKRSTLKLRPGDFVRFLNGFTGHVDSISGDVAVIKDSSGQSVYVALVDVDAVLNFPGSPQGIDQLIATDHFRKDN